MQSKPTVPVSSEQQEILLFSELSPESCSAFNEGFRLDLHGSNLAPDKAASALEILADRHDALSLVLDDDGASWVSPDPHQELPIHITGGDADEKDRCMVQLVNHAFQINRRRPWKAVVFQGKDCPDSVIFVAHHSICDGWSLANLIDEFSTLYQTSLNVDRLAPPGSFTDFLQRVDDTGPAATKPNSSYAQLPPDYAVSSDELDFSSETLSITIETSLKSAVDGLASSHGVSSFCVYSTAFKILLSRLTLSNEIKLGIPFAAQGFSEPASLTGHCVRFEEITFDIDSSLPFIEVARAGRALVSDTLKSNSGNSKCRHSHDYLNTRLHRDYRLSWRPVPAGVPHAKACSAPNGFSWQSLPRLNAYCALFCEINDLATTTVIDWHFLANLFDRETVKEWMLQFQTLLTNAVASPDTSVQKISGMPAESLDLITQKWSGVSRIELADFDIVSRFTAIAADYSNSPAVIDGDRIYSYRQLDAQSDAIASRLLNEPEPVVGIYLHRSVQAVASLLGILKAGAAYVPLDPAYPDLRTASTIEDSGIKTIISSASLAESISNISPESKIIQFEEASGVVDYCPPSIHKNDAAVILYTSGSTGQPKGAVIPHRAVIRTVIDTEFLHFHDAVTTLLISPLSFDVSLVEIFGALLNGGKVVMPPGPRPALTEIAETVEQHRVTTLWLTAGLFHLMIEETPESLRSVKELLVGGEVVSRDYMARALHHLPDCRIVEGYAPTENTAFCTFNDVHEADIKRAILPVGKTMRNSLSYIVDEYDNLLPPGCPGELLVGGPGLALGYINNPEITSRRFVNLPHINSDESLYRTGDLCRWLPDGRIEFLRRIDRQVKVRGFRIELGEIESVLREVKGIAVAAVTVEGDSPENRRICAHLVRDNSNADPNEITIQSFVARRLPEHAVPAVYCFHEKLEINSNGKIDYSKLTSQSANGLKTETGPVAPRNQLERSLARMFRSLLGDQTFGIEHSFFDLGGNSLLGLKLFSQIYRETDLKLPLGTLYTCPTIATLADAITNRKRRKTHQSVLTRGRVPSLSPLYLIHGADGGILFYRNLVEQLGGDRPVYGLESPMLVSRSVNFPERLDDLVENYLSELKLTDEMYLGGYSFGGLIALEAARRLQAKGIEVPCVYIFDTPNYAAGRDLNLIDRGAEYIRINGRGNSWLQNSHLLARRFQEGLTRKIVRDIKGKQAARLTAKGEGATSATLRAAQLHEGHLMLSASHTPNAYPGKVMIFRAENQGDRQIRSRMMGWESVLRPDTRVIDIPGVHEDMFCESNAELIAGILNSSFTDKAKNNQPCLVS